MLFLMTLIQMVVVLMCVIATYRSIKQGRYFLAFFLWFIPFLGIYAYFVTRPGA